MKIIIVINNLNSNTKVDKIHFKYKCVRKTILNEVRYNIRVGILFSNL